MKLIHDNEIVCGLTSDTTNVATTKTVFQGTTEQCQAEAARLNLLDPQGYFRSVTTLAMPERPSGPALPSAPASTIPARDFIDRFTATEYAAAKASADANIQKLLAMIGTGEPINLTDSRTIGGVNYCAAIGLIQSARVTAILAS